MRSLPSPELMRREGARAPGYARRLDRLPRRMGLSSCGPLRGRKRPAVESEADCRSALPGHPLPLTARRSTPGTTQLRPPGITRLGGRSAWRRCPATSRRVISRPHSSIGLPERWTAAESVDAAERGGRRSPTTADGPLGHGGRPGVPGSTWRRAGPPIRSDAGGTPRPRSGRRAAMSVPCIAGPRPPVVADSPPGSSSEGSAGEARPPPRGAVVAGQPVPGGPCHVRGGPPVTVATAGRRPPRARWANGGQAAPPKVVHGPRS